MLDQFSILLNRHSRPGPWHNFRNTRHLSPLPGRKINFPIVGKSSGPADFIAGLFLLPVIIPPKSLNLSFLLPQCHTNDLTVFLNYPWASQRQGNTARANPGDCNCPVAINSFLSFLSTVTPHEIGSTSAPVRTRPSPGVMVDINLTRSFQPLLPYQFPRMKERRSNALGQKASPTMQGATGLHRKVNMQPKSGQYLKKGRPEKDPAHLAPSDNSRDFNE